MIAYELANPEEREGGSKPLFVSIRFASRLEYKHTGQEVMDRVMTVMKDVQPLQCTS
jgi:hypothetical protein